MSVGHGEIRIVGGACVRAGCGRPARELGGYCTACWMGLTTAERDHLTWLHVVVDEELRSAAVDDLRALYALPAFERRL